jgi:hypothetical protein
MMKLSKRTRVALAALLVLPFVALWFSPSRPPPLRVTFHHAANDPANGRVGIIQVVNHQTEGVIVMGGWYVPAKREDLSLSRDTPIASLCDEMQGFKFTARSTNLVKVSMPTNGGPYKLVLQCAPESQDPWLTEPTLRHRMALWADSWVHPSQRTLVRWFGGFFAVSQSIDIDQ